ncbi:outer mitochondrial translocase subunit [Culex quinquefasciatus]|uniref:Outer mitochondrial translocase subunit n=1 Tax=Culex quinquefasciatus TaxID=7176 RepID=B0X1H4_CULQU|nr:outer mitochondrial translocase subunit [Culex quinquefasciatus]|eukprot:XP_001863496.1 outer mitochondrial translocase subunit [Culex quinquefasciatus]
MPKKPSSSCREDSLPVDEPCLPSQRRTERLIFPKPLITVEGIARAPLNPGDFASLHQRTYELRPEWFEGFQLNASKTLAVHRVVRASSRNNLYNHERHSFAATGSREAFDLSYWRRVNGRLQIGSSLACSHREGKAIGTIYYRLEHPDCTVRGLFDSDWSIGFTYQRKLSQMPIVAGLSLLFCIPKNTFQSGFKIDLDSNLQ